MNNMPLQECVERAAKPVPKDRKGTNRKFFRAFCILLGLLALTLWTAPGQANTISAGEYHSLGVMAGGRVVAWGLNNKGQCNVPPDLTRVVAVAGGMNHNIALKSDGTVAAWGLNANDQSTVPPGA